MATGTPPLPIALRPHYDELVSSWLARTAAMYDVSVDELRRALWSTGPKERARPDIHIDRAEARAFAKQFRVKLDVVLALELKRRWPGLACVWLPSTDGTGRARGPLDLAWCYACLAERHLAGGAYLDWEAALPLVFCHRHQTWRQDHCRRCHPRNEPIFVLRATPDLVCGDCGSPLRWSRRAGPTLAIDIDPDEATAAFPIMLAFDGEVRRALLGQPARLPGAGQVPAREFLAVLADLTRALLAPSMFDESAINHFDCPLLPEMREVVPPDWDERPYHELSPFMRTWVLSAVVALLADESVSRLLAGVRSPSRQHPTLEWLLTKVAGWVQASLIGASVHWPAPLRARVSAHQQRTGMDAADILGQFHAWRAEYEQRQRERTSLIG